jgi:aminomethyltransferase
MSIPETGSAPPAPAAYQAARGGVAWRDESDIGRMILAGRDRAALLQRLTTNDMSQIAEGSGVRTVFTSPIGRIIDVVTVHAIDDALLLLTGPGQGPAVYGLLRRNIFFNDQVTLTAAGRRYAQLTLYGPAGAAALQALCGTPTVPAAPHQIVRTAPGDDGWLLIGRRPLGVPVITVLLPADAAAGAQAALAQHGAVPLDDATAQVLHVEAGEGRTGAEFSEHYIPLETGLLDAISFTKGCYVGQEIIARMESRGRMARRLCGLRLDAPATAPAPLWHAGADAGTLTSAVVSPRLGPVGLGYIRTAHAYGTHLTVGSGDTRATVVELPFRDA